MQDRAVETFSFLDQAARCLLALLQPLTGDRGAGQVTLTAPPGETVVVERNRAMYPVVGGVLRADLAFKTAEGPAVGGNWLVSDAGTVVDVVSIIGGRRHNLAAGTVLQLEPPSMALLSTPAPALLANVTSATDRPGYATVKDAVIFETMDGPALSLDMKKSALKDFPSVVVTWVGSFPQTGPTSQHAAGISRGGEKVYLYSSRFKLSVVTSRADSDARRRGEGKAILNALMLLLAGRQSVDGEVFSSPSGVRVLSALREDGPQDEYKKFYVYNLTVSVESALQSVDYREFADWLRTSVKALKP